ADEPSVVVGHGVVGIDAQRLVQILQCSLIIGCPKPDYGPGVVLLGGRLGAAVARGRRLGRADRRNERERDQRDDNTCASKRLGVHEIPFRVVLGTARTARPATMPPRRPLCPQPRACRSGATGGTAPFAGWGG